MSDVIANDPLKYTGMKSLTHYVERHHIEREVPFANLPAGYLRAAVDGFNKHFRPLIVGVLTKFKIYKNFIAEVHKRGGIEGELAFYMVQPEKAGAGAVGLGGGMAEKKIDEPQEELAAMKNEDWPFFAVFQKGLMRASTIAWRQYAVVGGSKDSTIHDFLADWLAFLDEIADRGLMKVKAGFPKNEKVKVWVGISLNTSSETVRWSEASVQRIAVMLVLWWYFYSTKKSQIGSFIKKLNAPRGNETYPARQGTADRYRQGAEVRGRKVG